MAELTIGVTGAAGALGRVLLAVLARRPGLCVRALSRQPCATHATAVEWRYGDLQDAAVCADFVAGLDVLFHFAHGNAPLTADRDWAADARHNLLPTLNLLSAIERAGRRLRFIYPSSGGAVYGATASADPTPESAPCRPDNAYGIQKLAIELYLRMFAERNLLDATVLRIGNAYGWLLAPERMQGFIGTATQRIRLGLPVRLVGNPANVRDYVHADDVAAALLAALNGPTGFEVFNIGSGSGASVTEVLAVFAEVLGHPVATETLPFPEANLLPARSVLAIDKARMLLGWQPRISLRDGIARMLAAAR